MLAVPATQLGPVSGVALRAEALGEDAQRDGLAGAGGECDEGEAAVADELLDVPTDDSMRRVTCNATGTSGANGFHYRP